MLAGLKLDEAPEGKPLNERFTVPVKPFKAETVAVYVVPVPWTTVLEDGVAAIVKSGLATICRKRATEGTPELLRRNNM